MLMVDRRWLAVFISVTNMFEDSSFRSHFAQGHVSVLGTHQHVVSSQRQNGQDTANTQVRCEAYAQKMCKRGCRTSATSFCLSWRRQHGFSSVYSNNSCVSCVGMFAHNENNHWPSSSSHYQASYHNHLCLTKHGPPYCWPSKYNNCCFYVS